MKDQAIELGKTLARVFVGTLLAAVVAAGIGVLEWDTWTEWKVPLVGAAIAVGVAILNALNWKDTRYGINGSSE